MKIKPRALLAGLFFGLAGAACAAPETPAYFNFFASPVRIDRYLRNMQAMELMRTATEPVWKGTRSLEMQLRFTDKRRQGVLRWDFAPVAFSRVRFSVYNPNPERYKIFINARFVDSEKRVWQLSNGDKPLVSKDWNTIDAVLTETASVKQKKEQVNVGGLKPVFDYFDLEFSVQKDFTALDQPFLLYLGGLECF
ncbi:MAG: hypothetical protein WC701_06760 [Kiritimatiellales bacterium]|jgi:hypothetical protein